MTNTVFQMYCLDSHRLFGMCCVFIAQTLSQMNQFCVDPGITQGVMFSAETKISLNTKRKCLFMIKSIFSEKCTMNSFIFKIYLHFLKMLLK